MESIRVTPEQVNARVARFSELVPLTYQQDSSLPTEAMDVIYSRRILSVIGLDSGESTVINTNAPIRGAGGITVTYACCPPGTGPALHAHVATYETFTVVQGKFEFMYNDDGSGRVILDRFDTISMEPGVVRAFRNISDEEGILQVIISGGVHDLNDIDFSPAAEKDLREHGDEAVDYFTNIGFTFEAVDGKTS